MRLDTMALMRLTLTLFQSAGTNPILSPHAHNCFARPAGWLCEVQRAYGYYQG